MEERKGLNVAIDESEYAVMKAQVEEHQKMIKGNGSPGMYRMMIEMHATLGRFKRIEAVIWTVCGGLVLAGVIGGIKVYG